MLRSSGRNLRSTTVGRSFLSLAISMTSAVGQAQDAPRLGNPLADAMSFDVWRREHRIIDLHQHIETNPDRLHRAVKINRYTEFEWAPSGETLDLKLDLPSKDFDWSAGAESMVLVDETAKVWRVEVRIPLNALSEHMPQHGTRWRINLYRHDRSEKAFLAMSPTLKGTFHAPERFGWLEFAKE